MGTPVRSQAVVEHVHPLLSSHKHAVEHGQPTNECVRSDGYSSGLLRESKRVSESIVHDTGCGQEGE
ncbi:hypothetical protein [Natrialba sp. SSL1]|uniref:hypothetical protein n=1 Tax=Natrialba sp. SSL1 TaxID=1869245 RepID=UPI001113F027|nr:hypothetical protein [Natrialba sp. SSL1]